MIQKYIVRVAKSDSVTNIEYTNVIHVWWQEGGQVLGIQMGERGKDRSYIYYPVSHIDHVHIREVNEKES